jgi:hypothetical protein
MPRESTLGVVLRLADADDDLPDIISLGMDRTRRSRQGFLHAAGVDGA